MWLADGSVSPTFSVTELLASDSLRELLSLRYDLTVPFARFLALHSVGNIKRYVTVSLLLLLL